MTAGASRDAGPAGGGHGAAGRRSGASGVVLAVEQLRRRVPGGIGRYAEGLLFGLRRLGQHEERALVRVELLASRHLGGGGDPLEQWGFCVRASALPAPLLALAWDRGLAPAPRDAAVVHSISLAAPPVRPPRPRRGAALVVTVHDLAWRAHPEATTRRGRRWHEAALRRALTRADAFVTPSAQVADTLVGAGAPRERVRVIAHGADHLPVADRDGASRLLDQLGAGNGYLLCAGTLEPRKNLRTLVAAYARARPSLPHPWPLVVVGPSGWGDGAATVIGREAAGVVFAGHVSDGVLASLYSEARAFAYVPLTEGFGLPPVEAMACGTPVVTSTTVPSALPAGGRAAPALRVDPTAVDEIAGALVGAASDEALRAELIARGNERVRHLTWERSATAHLDWWRELS